MQKKSVQLLLAFWGILAPLALSAQTARKLSVKETDKMNENNDIVAIHKQVNRRIRWDKLTFDTTAADCPSKLGYAMYNNQRYSGGFFNTFPAASGEKVVTSREGSLLNGLMHGEYAEYNKAGIKQLKETWANGKKNGPFTYYYENGMPEIVGAFKDNELDGDITGYYIDGTKKYFKQYTNGVRNGAANSYFESGQIEQEATFVNDLPDGDAIGYYPKGNIRNIQTYKMGILHGRHYVFHRNGCAGIEEYFKDGLLDSVQRLYDALSCNLINSGYYKKGKRFGQFLSYDMFGDTLTIENFDDSVKHGYFATFLEVWDPVVKRNILQIETAGNYVHGSPDGYWRYGQVSNKFRREGVYDLGVKIGEWKYFDDMGDLMLVQTYDQDGNLLKQKFHKRKKHD